MKNKVKSCLVNIIFFILLVIAAITLYGYVSLLWIVAVVLAVRVLVWLHHYNCSWRVAQIACCDDSETNYLVCGGYLYKTDIERNKHAEKTFIEKATPRGITEIWMKYSPCVLCSQKLSAFFCNETEKPTIYSAKVWRDGNKEDEENLRELQKEGFKLKTWKELADRMGKGNRQHVESHLAQINRRNEQCAIL